jgi:hypothetical protein
MVVDGILLNAGSGGSTLAVDTIGSKEYQFIKVTFGTVDSVTIVDSSNPLPVVMADVLATLGTTTYSEGVTKGTVIGAVRNDDVASLANTDNEISPLQVDELGALWVHESPALIDTGNSTTSTLTSGSTFTGTGVDTLKFNSVTAIIHASHDSAINGMLFEFSSDNTNWDESNTFTYTAGNGARTFQFPANAQFFRFKYTNGGTGQTTFRAQIILHHAAQITTIHRLSDNVDPDRSSQLMKTAIIAQAAGTGDFVPVQSTTAGNLKVSVEEADVSATGPAKAEDAVHTSGDTGVMSLAVRNDALAALAGTDGDYAPFQVNASGALYIQEGAALDVSAATLTVNAHAVTNAGTFVVQEDGAALTALQLIDDPIFVDDAPFTLASSSVNMSGAIRDDTPSALSAVEGDAVPLRVDSTGKLHTKSHVFDPGTLDSFGHLVTSEAANQVDIQFFRDTPANLTTVTIAGGGATSQVGGAGKWETSTAATANAKSVTTQNTSYRSGSEVFAVFTATFTAGVANSFQRIGLYDTNNGFFIGYEGTSFGVTVRNNTSDTTTAKASFSEDVLTGAAGSAFTRDGTPEAIDLTKFNVFRIRFGWFGSAPPFFEVLSPDGNWVTFHKILQPNNATVASIENPDLPVTLHVDKSGADATNIIMTSNCWGAGINTLSLPLNETLTDDTLASISRNVIVGKTAGGSYVNVQTTTGGNLKMALDEYDGVPIGGGVEAGSLRVTIANNSTGLVSIDDGGGTLTVDSGAAFTVQEDGAALTALQVIDNPVFADDAAFTLTSSSVMMSGAIRDDTLSTLTAVEGDSVPLRVGSTGALHVTGAGGGTQYSVDDAGPTVVTMAGAVRDDSLTTLTEVDGDATLLRVSSTGALHVTGGGGGTEYTEDIATPNPIVGTATMMERDDALSTLTPVAGDWVGLRSNARGALWVEHDTTTAIPVTDNGGALTIDWAGTAPPIGAGVEATALRVTLATDSTGVVSVDDNGGALTVDNDGTFATQATLQAGTAEIGKLAANSGVDIGDVDVLSIAAGSNLVGDVGLQPRTSGGLTIFKSIDLDESEEEIKATAGQVYAIHAMNLKASVLYLKIYNATAATVVVGTTAPDITIPLPTQGDTNGAGFTWQIPQGIAFGTAITVACTTGIADNDSGAPGANECVVTILYK